jgi:hypothetical protein
VEIDEQPVCQLAAPNVANPFFGGMHNIYYGNLSSMFVRLPKG